MNVVLSPKSSDLNHSNEGVQKRLAIHNFLKGFQIPLLPQVNAEVEELGDLESLCDRVKQGMKKLQKAIGALRSPAVKGIWAKAKKRCCAVLLVDLTSKYALLKPLLLWVRTNRLLEQFQKTTSLQTAFTLIHLIKMRMETDTPYVQVKKAVKQNMQFLRTADAMLREKYHQLKRDNVALSDDVIVHLVDEIEALKTSYLPGVVMPATEKRPGFTVCKNGEFLIHLNGGGTYRYHSIRQS